MRIALVFCTIDDVFQRYPAGVFSLFESNPPLGLAAIGTIAKERHHAVRIFDPLLHHQDMEALLADILSFAPDLVGFACTSLNVAHSAHKKTLRLTERFFVRGAFFEFFLPHGVCLKLPLKAGIKN